MYGKEQGRIAMEAFIRFDRSAADTIRELGHPNRQTLYDWRKEHRLRGERFLEDGRRRQKVHRGRGTDRG